MLEDIREDAHPPPHDLWSSSVTGDAGNLDASPMVSQGDGSTSESIAPNVPKLNTEEDVQIPPLMDRGPDSDVSDLQSLQQSNDYPEALNADVLPHLAERITAEMAVEDRNAILGKLTPGASPAPDSPASAPSREGSGSDIDPRRSVSGSSHLSSEQEGRLNREHEPKGTSSQRGRLVLLAEGSESHTWYLQGGHLTVGRALGNEVVLDDPGVSHRHAQLTLNEGTFQIADLGSLNGTYVNGSPVIRSELSHGDLLQVGGSTLRFGVVGANRASQNTSRDVAQTFGMLFGMVIPGRWLLAMGLCTFFAVLITLVAVRSLVPPPSLDPEKEGHKWLAESIRSEEARDWLRAKDDLRIAKLLAPNIADFGSKIARVIRESKNLDALENLRRQSQSDTAVKTLRSYLESVAVDSVYRAEAEDIFSISKTRFVESELGWIQSNWGARPRPDVLQRLARLKKSLPDDPRVVEFMTKHSLVEPKE